MRSITSGVNPRICSRRDFGAGLTFATDVGYNGGGLSRRGGSPRTDASGESNRCTDARVSRLDEGGSQHLKSAGGDHSETFGASEVSGITQRPQIMHLPANGTAHGIDPIFLQTIDRVANTMLFAIHAVLILILAIAHNDCHSVEFFGLHSRRHLHRLVIYLMSLRRTRKPFSRNVRGEHLATLAPVRVVLVRGDGENRRHCGETVRDMPVSRCSEQR